MAVNYNWLKRTIISGLFLWIGVSMSACSTSMNWKEEALQNDGSIIVVERTVERAGRHEIGQPPPIKEQRLSFTLPDTGQHVIWKDQYTEDVGGASFLPMLLAVSKDSAYLVVTPAGCLPYNKWGRPNPPYVVFKYQSNAWQRIALQELPLEFKQVNLALSSPDDAAKEARHGLLTSEQIKQWNSSDTRLPEYQTILRTPGVYSETGCMKEVYDGNGGWMSEDWFTNQPTQEACLKVCKQNHIDAKYCPCGSLFKGK